MSTFHLPRFAPDVAKLSKIRGAEFLPFALFSLAGISTKDSESLVATLDKDNTTGSEPNAIHLVSLAPESRLQQKTLYDILDAHIQYCTTNMDKLKYFPFGFLAAHDRDWDRHGLYLVYIDFENPFEVTGFRIAVKDVPAAANTLRDDDDGAKEVRDIHEMNT